MLGEVIRKAMVCWGPVHVVLLLVDAIPDPIETHVDGLGSSFNTIPTKNGRELMEKWVSELKDKFLGPNWQRMLSCAYTTQLLHSTGEVCWNNRDSYFIWFEFVC